MVHRVDVHEGEQSVAEHVVIAVCSAFVQERWHMAVAGARSCGDVPALARQLACRRDTQVGDGRDALDECTCERRESFSRRCPYAEGRRTRPARVLKLGLGEESQEKTAPVGEPADQTRTPALPCGDRQSEIGVRIWWSVRWVIFQRPSSRR